MHDIILLVLKVETLWFKWGNITCVSFVRETNYVMRVCECTWHGRFTYCICILLCFLGLRKKSKKLIDFTVYSICCLYLCASLTTTCELWPYFAVFCPLVSFFCAKNRSFSLLLYKHKLENIDRVSIVLLLLAHCLFF